MAKLTIVVALMVAFLVLTEASFRATVTTTVEEEEANPSRGSGGCREELEEERFQSCQRWLSSRQQQGRYEEDRFDIVNPQSSVQDCCNELEDVKTECRCQALQRIAQKVQQQQGQQGQQGRRESSSRYPGQQGSRSVQEKITQIPQMCHIQFPQECQGSSRAV